MNYDELGFYDDLEEYETPDWTKEELTLYPNNVYLSSFVTPKTIQSYHDYASSVYGDMLINNFNSSIYDVKLFNDIKLKINTYMLNINYEPLNFSCGESDDPNTLTCIYWKLVAEHNMLEFMLNMDDYYDLPPTPEILAGIAKNNGPNPLPKQVGDQLRQFSINTIGVDLIDLEDRYELILNQNVDILSALIGTYRILKEQRKYCHPDNVNHCNIQFLYTRLNGYLYGGTFVFYHLEHPDYVVMQGISKFFIPTLFALLYPELESKLPRLNSILQGMVEELTIKISATKIYVAPIGKQGDILEKYYGYQKTTPFPFPFPCSRIEAGERPNKPTYVKYV